LPFQAPAPRRCCEKPSGKLSKSRGSESIRLDLNAEIVVRVDELDKQVKLFLVDMSQNDARLRAGVMLAPQTGVSFRWMGPSRDPILVHGHVADIKMADKRTAEYGIEFNLPAALQEKLASELREIARRKGIKSEPAIAALPAALDEGDDEFERFGGITKRKAYRAMVQFPVELKLPKRNRIATVLGEARDLSIGGMLLQLADDVEEGTEIEIAFTLPFEPAADREQKEVVEITPFGERRVKKSVTKERRIERLHTKARVLKSLGNTRNGAPLYGIGFVEMPSYLTEEIARWIHAHQLKNLRKNSGTRKALVAGDHARPERTFYTARDRFEPRTQDNPIKRAIVARHPHDRRFTFAAFAKNHEVVRLPLHAAARSTYSETDVFGFGNNGVEDRAAAKKPCAPPNAEQTSVEDVFGLGVLENAS